MTQPDTIEREPPSIQARTVRDFCRAYGVGKTVAFELINAGRLLAVKAGRRTLVDEASARAWYDSLPRRKPAHIPAHILNPETGGLAANHGGRVSKRKLRARNGIGTNVEL